MAQLHLTTFANSKEFADAYNSGKLGVPYVAVISDIKDEQNKSRVFFSNRLPYKEGEIEPPQRLSHNCVCGQWLLGASRL